jgi:acyl-CoA thioesterase I
MAQTVDRIKALLAAKTPIKWVFAGDSITHGAFHTQGWRDYTELFSERIRYEMGRDLDCVIKTAASGWKIENLAQHLEWCVIQYCPHVLSIHMGMNDASDGGPNGVEAFKTTYSSVIERVRKANGAEIMLHTPQQVMREASRFPLLPPYIEAIRDLARKHEAMLIDHYAHWGEFSYDRVMYWSSDQIHPNEYGHREIAYRLMNELGIFDPRGHTCKLLVP